MLERCSGKGIMNAILGAHVHEYTARTQGPLTTVTLKDTISGHSSACFCWVPKILLILKTVNQQHCKERNGFSSQFLRKRKMEYC